jgi:murein DD-endopeptidase MepM/ murein hydrolase activator NlpD
MAKGIASVGSAAKKAVDLTKVQDRVSALGPTRDAAAAMGQPPTTTSNWVTDQGADLSKLGVVTTPFGGSTVSSNNPRGGEHRHPGVDVASKRGTPIPALRSGTVTEVARGRKQGDAGYGNYVVVTDYKGNKWRYSHLADTWVQVGQRVRAGQNIAPMGNSGNTFSNHGGDGTHLDLRILNAQGQLIDPSTLGIRTS